MQEFFYETEKCCVLFYTTALAASCGALQANRYDFYFFRNAVQLEANSTNQSCDYVQPVAAALRNGTVHCVKKHASHCGAAERRTICSTVAVVPCVTLRCVTEC